MRILPLLLFPFLELWLMIEVGDEVGGLAVILWLVAMIVVGMNLLRYLGASSMIKVAQNMRTGELPGAAIADGLFKAIGAVLLIIPGFITDALALLCFIPWLRQLFIKRWVAKMTVRAAGFAQQQSPFGRSPFGSEPFGAGNIYEHEGAAHSSTETSREGVLIEQDAAQPSATSGSPSPKKP